MKKENTRNQILTVLRYTMPVEAALMWYLDKPALCALFTTISLIAFIISYETND